MLQEAKTKREIWKTVKAWQPYIIEHIRRTKELENVWLMEEIEERNHEDNQGRDSYSY